MIEKSILKRRSVREFKPDPIDDNLIEELLEAAIYAPSAMGNHALEFIIIKDKSVQEQLFQAQSGEKQAFIEEAPLIIVITTNINKTDCPMQDISVASENLMLQAAALGIGSVWKNVDNKFETAVKEILNIPADFRVINLICLGYPNKEIALHQKTDYKLKIHHDKFV